MLASFRPSLIASATRNRVRVKVSALLKEASRKDGDKQLLESEERQRPARSTNRPLRAMQATMELKIAG